MLSNSEDKIEHPGKDENQDSACYGYLGPLLVLQLLVSPGDDDNVLFLVDGPLLLVFV